MLFALVSQFAVIGSGGLRKTAIHRDIEQSFADLCKPAEPGSHEIEASFWSDDIPFGAVVLGSGEVQLGAPKGLVEG